MNRSTLSRLAVYAADQLVTGADTVWVAERVAASLVSHNLADEFGRFSHLLEAELARRGITQVTVTSAVALTDITKMKLAQKLGATHPIINEVIDASIVGGTRVETSELLLDLTLKRKLSRFTLAARSTS